MTTRTLAEFVHDLTFEALPSQVRARVPALALDLAGIMVRARHEAESTPAMIAAARRLGFTPGACTVIGDAAGYTPAGAAMVNGTLAHSLDFDDTHAPGSLHPSAPIVPAALAAAEMTGAGGRSAIAAPRRRQARCTITSFASTRSTRRWRPSQDSTRRHWRRRWTATCWPKGNW